MRIRRRLLPALLGFGAFTGLGSVTDYPFWTQPWFWIGLGVLVSATFVEPYFARPQDAIVNAAGGIAAYVSAERDPIAGLWLAYLIATIVILAAGLIATLAAEGPTIPKWISFRIASRFGRAAIIGTAALLLIVLRDATIKNSGFEYLAAATAFLVAGVAIDWPSVFARVRRRAEAATALAAIGPRMLLVAASGSTGFKPGDDVAVEAAEHQVMGSVVARLPHHEGLRYQIALSADWSDLCSRFPGNLVLRAATEQTETVGAVGDGSSDLTLQFEPFRATEIGAPVSIQVDNRKLLYQIAQLRLTSSSWAGANAVVPHATARIVGWPEADGTIKGGSHLPEAHELIHEADGLEQPLADGFYEIGRLKRTAIPIGLRVDDERRGHIAILGMSGMGKTAVAQRICRTLGDNNVVVALDTTGEYATRLDFPPFEGDLATPGYSVLEPSGDPPAKAAAFIKDCMTAGDAEYRDENAEIVRRVILLEEAHGFVPEWNFALRNQQDQVAFSTRMIMQARKFGITFVLVSQRTAVVSKSALSQCENYIILRTIDQTSLEYLESVVGHEMRNAIPSLERWEAICVGPAFNAEMPVIVTLSPP